MKTKPDIKIIFDEQGNKESVLININTFEKLIDELEDLKDLTTVYEREIKNLKPVPLEKIKELFSNAKK